jgi:hypothetical protein
MYSELETGHAGSSCLITHSPYLMMAIGHLYKAMDLLKEVNNRIVEQAVDGLDSVEKLSDSWLEVNRCRIYTEQVDHLEGLLIPALGLINDAKCMLESVIHWKIGMTIYAKHNILSCIKEAALEGIGPTLEELEFCLHNNQDPGEEDFWSVH